MLASFCYFIIIITIVSVIICYIREQEREQFPTCLYSLPQFGDYLFFLI